MENLFTSIAAKALQEALKLVMEAENQEEAENELLEVMYMYGRYRRIVQEQAYVTRGSRLYCDHGTNDVWMDLHRDYGVYMGTLPLMTCQDCHPFNFVNNHNFGSCRRLEEDYAGRLPMTPECWDDGIMALKISKNEKAHICMPLIDEDHGWRQIDNDLLIETKANAYAPVLLSNAVLVCQYGGIIRIREVAEEVITPEEETLEEYIKETMTTLGWTANDDEVIKIKDILENFGITDRISIACFLLLCISETGAEGLYSREVDRNGQPYVDEYGRAVTEYYPKNKEGYTFEERGVGYMQVTGREDQLACLKYLKTMGYYQGEIDEYAPGYTEELRTMPWQTSAWRWAVYDQTKKHSLNAYIAEQAKDNGDKLTLGMVLTAESFINGRVSKLTNPPEKISENPNEDYNTPNNALAAIASGKLPQTIGGEEDDNHWHTEGNYLYVGGWRYRAPNNWPHFMANYYILFPQEERRQ